MATRASLVRVPGSGALPQGFRGVGFFGGGVLSVCSGVPWDPSSL